MTKVSKIEISGITLPYNILILNYTDFQYININY